MTFGSPSPAMLVEVLLNEYACGEATPRCWRRTKKVSRSVSKIGVEREVEVKSRTETTMCLDFQEGSPRSTQRIVEGTRLLHFPANLTHASERGRRFICTEARQTFLAKLRYGVRIANQNAVAWLFTLDPSLKRNCRTAASGPVRPINDSPPRAVCCCFHSSPIPSFLPFAANAVVAQVQPPILLKQRELDALAKRCLGVSTCCADHLFLATIRPMLDRQAQERQQILVTGLASPWIWSAAAETTLASASRLNIRETRISIECPTSAKTSVTRVAFSPDL